MNLRMIALAAAAAFFAASASAQVPLYTDNYGQHKTPTVVACVNETTGAVESCGGSGSGGTVTITGPAGTQTILNSIAVTQCDGCDVTLGTEADAAWTTGSGTVVAILKNMAAGIASPGNMQGIAAQAASDTDIPLNDGCRAATATPTAVTDGQKVVNQCTVGGEQVVVVGAIPENHTQGVTAAMGATTSTLLLAAPASGLRNYVTHISCGNSHATVGTFVTVQDGSGGTAIGNLTAAAVYGGESDTDAAVLYRQPTTATGLYVANVTTGANVICEASGYVAP
jgi:hypothetical protein